MFYLTSIVSSHHCVKEKFAFCENSDEGKPKSQQILLTYDSGDKRCSHDKHFMATVDEKVCKLHFVCRTIDVDKTIDQ